MIDPTFLLVAVPYIALLVEPSLGDVCLAPGCDYMAYISGSEVKEAQGVIKHMKEQGTWESSNFKGYWTRRATASPVFRSQRQNVSTITGSPFITHADIQTGKFTGKYNSGRIKPDLPTQVATGSQFQNLSELEKQKTAVIPSPEVLKKSNQTLGKWSDKAKFTRKSVRAIREEQYRRGVHRRPPPKPQSVMVPSGRRGIMFVLKGRPVMKTSTGRYVYRKPQSIPVPQKPQRTMRFNMDSERRRRSDPIANDMRKDTVRNLKPSRNPYDILWR